MGALSLLVIFYAAGLPWCGIAPSRKWRLFELLTIGYLSANLGFLLLALASPGTWLPLYILLGLIGLALGMSVKNRPGRTALYQAIRSTAPEEAIVLFLVILLVGWPFLGWHPLAPWGTANGDLFDSLNGAVAISSQPDLFGMYTGMWDGSFNTGQYTSAALSYGLCQLPVGLLSDYWHLLTLHAIASGGIAAIARERLGLRCLGAIATGLIYGTSCLIGITIYNGHVGTTIHLALFILVLYQWMEGGGGHDILVRSCSLGMATCFLFCSYAYSLPLLLAPPATVIVIVLLQRHWSVDLFRQPTKSLVLIGVAMLATVMMIGIYPHFEGYRHKATDFYRAWSLSLRPEIVLTIWGLEPSGLTYSPAMLHLKLALMAKVIVAVFLSVGVLVACLHAWFLQPRMVAFSVACLSSLLLYLGIRFVVGDSYYTYKSIYLAFPILCLCLATWLVRWESSPPWRWMGLALATLVITLNGMSLYLCQQTMISAPFNRQYQESTGFIEACRTLRSQGRSITMAATDRELALIADSINLRNQLMLAENAWAWHGRQSEPSRNPERDRRNDDIRTTIKPVKYAELQLSPTRTPDILRIAGVDYPLSWKNSLWQILDRGALPAFETYCDGRNAVTCVPTTLNGAPFRWVNRTLSFRVERWPADHVWIHGFAQAGYAATSGEVDLRIRLNDQVILDTTIDRPQGKMFTLHVGSHLTSGVDVLEFTGVPRPGPPLDNLELRNLKFLVSSLSLSASPNPWASSDLLPLFAGTRWRWESSLGGLALGDGWGPEESDVSGKKLRWLYDCAARLVVTRKINHGQIIRLGGSRVAGKRIRVNYPDGTIRVVPIRNTEIVFIPDSDLAPGDALTLQVVDEITAAGPDPRHLVFRVDSMAIETP